MMRAANVLDVARILDLAERSRYRDRDPRTITCRDRRRVLWFYTRDQDTLTLDLRYDNDSHEYVATTIGAATPISQTSRVRTANQFRAWLEAFDRKMIGTSWKVKGPPHILADRWPDKRPLR